MRDSQQKNQQETKSKANANNSNTGGSAVASPPPLQLLLNDARDDFARSSDVEEKEARQKTEKQSSRFRIGSVSGGDPGNNGNSPIQAFGLRNLHHSGTHTESQSTNGTTIQLRRNRPQSDSFRQLLGLKVPVFKERADANDDWENGLENHEKRTMRRILALLDAQALEYCADMYLFLFPNLVQGTLGSTRAFRMYLNACAGNILKGPAETLKTPSLHDAIVIGESLVKLSRGIPDYILKGALTVTTFNSIRNGGFIDDLANYYRRGQPIFESAKDFQAYYDFRATDGGNPMDYKAGELGQKVRSPHKFHKATMDNLQANYGDTSKTKPLTLYIHAGVDHNGAFIRDPANTSLTGNGSILALLVEGRSSIGEITNLVRPMARKYGQNNRIAQTIFAGHGDASSMEIAGGVRRGADGGIEARGRSLDVNSRSGRRLIDRVIANMENPTAAEALNGPHGRIMFNACLTNSHDAAEAVMRGDIEGTSVAVNQYIRDNPNLREYTERRANQMGHENMTVMGANASTSYGLGFADADSGRLNYDTTNYNYDHESSVNGDKFQYVEFGRELTGLNRAAVEAFAINRRNFLAAVNRRIAANRGGTKEQLIRLAFRIIVNHFSNDVRGIAFSIQFMDRIFSNGINLRQPNSIPTLNDPWRPFFTNRGMGTIFEGFTSIEHYSFLQPQVVYHQAWAVFNNSKRSTLISRIGQQNATFMKDYVNTAFLIEQNLHRTLLSGAISNGRDVLAILLLKADNSQPEALAYLRRRLQLDNTLPAAVTDRAGSEFTADQLLALVRPAAPVEGG